MSHAAIAAIDLSRPHPGVALAVGTVVKHPAPLFQQDTPWETRIDNGYPNAMRSPSGTWRLFYGTCEKSCSSQLLLYANSSDGITWHKPSLGLFDLGKVRPDLKAIGKENNILLQGGGIGIFEDIDATAPSRRFIAFGPGCYDLATSDRGCNLDLLAPPSSRRNYPTQDIAYSADGLTWLNASRIGWPSPQRYDCHNNLTPIKGAASRRWLATTRDGFSASPGRTIGITSSLEGGQGITFNTSTAPNVTLSGRPDKQLYSQITFPWHDIYLGIVMIYDAGSKADKVHCHLAWARASDVTSLHAWRWVDQEKGVDGTPLIPLGEASSFDSHICFASRPVSYNGTERIYYFGGNGPHSGDRNSSLGLATLRQDGYAGVRADDKGGSFFTVPLKVTGATLVLTADVQPGGELRIGCEDCEGLHAVEAEPIKTNVTSAAVRFAVGADFAKLVGKEVRLEAVLSGGAAVYAVGFR